MREPEKGFVQQLWQDARQILAVAGSAQANSDETHVICLARDRSIHVVVSPGDCSLYSLAVDLGADRMYRVERRNGALTVEGWRAGESILLKTGLPVVCPSRPFYTTREILGL